MLPPHRLRREPVLGHAFQGSSPPASPETSPPEISLNVGNLHVIYVDVVLALITQVSQRMIAQGSPFRKDR